MFSGGALDVEEEEDDEKRAQMEQYAKAMGMSVEEYQLGMNARLRMETAINDLRVIGGDVANGVTVERDGNMPPRHLVVTVTDVGKAKGKDTLEKLIVEALKSAADKGKIGREEAQKDMMKYISDSMKKMGMK
jgi:DNA-binding protein YbaB